MATQTIEQTVDDVLRLLVFVTTADTKIYQQEIDSFLEVAVSMQLTDTDGIKLKRAWLFDWFLHNCEEIRAQSSSDQANSKIVHLFVRLQSWPNKENLLEGLCSVAAADGQYHINEKVLIALAAAYWGEQTPAMI